EQLTSLKHPSLHSRRVVPAHFLVGSEILFQCSQDRISNQLLRLLVSDVLPPDATGERDRRGDESQNQYQAKKYVRKRDDRICYVSLVSEARPTCHVSPPSSDSCPLPISASCVRVSEVRGLVSSEAKRGPGLLTPLPPDLSMPVAMTFSLLNSPSQRASSRA